jgi:hypothetical protein
MLWILHWEMLLVIFWASLLHLVYAIQQIHCYVFHNNVLDINLTQCEITLREENV